MASCELLSNYLRVLLLIGQDANLRIRDLAAMVGITDRAIQRIVEQLEADDYLSHERSGRRNVYTINRDRRIDELALSIGELLDLMAQKRGEQARETVPTPAPWRSPLEAKR